MLERIRNRLKFYLERSLLRGAHYRLLFIAALLGLVSVGAGTLVLIVTGDFKSLGEATWWAFLRLSDPGYLGDDKGFMLRTVSTVVTILGYILFMGSLVAIMTQWLNETIANLEKGYTPIAQKNHILILGWTNRTPNIVLELFLSEGRVKRFLRRLGAKRLRIVILAEQVTTKLRYELKDYLRELWDERRITFRSGSSLRIEHLRRADYMNASVIILPGYDFELGELDEADMRTIKTLLSISNHGRLEGKKDLPFIVAEIFDARKIPVAKTTYKGKIEILASDSVISLLIAQNVRHNGLSHVYSELLGHGEGNEIYVRECPEFTGQRLQDLVKAFPKAILFGVLRRDASGYKPVLNPPGGFTLADKDRLTFIAEAYKDTEPLSGYTPEPTEKGIHSGASEDKLKRRILIMGWNDKVPALIHEFDSYENVAFELDILSMIPTAQREEKLSRYNLHTELALVRQLEGDYAAPSDLVRINPAGYDNIIVLGCDWLKSKEEADARTVHGYLMLREILTKHKEKPEILVELLDPENHSLFEEAREEVLISPIILSHILAQVALRPDLNIIFHELFSSGGAEIYFRSVDFFNISGRKVSFGELQELVALQGEIALGVKIHAYSETKTGGIELNPDRDKSWAFEADDEIVVLTTYI
jgi:ion channel POLLUX/CASTOR